MEVASCPLIGGAVAIASCIRMNGYRKDEKGEYCSVLCV